MKELCEIIDARPGKEPGLEVTDIAEPSEARENDIIYLADKKHREAVDRSRARVVLTSPALAQGLSKDKILLLSDKLQESFIRLLDFFEDKDKSSNTVSDSSVVHGSVKQGRDITIMDHVFISQDAVIGDGSVIYPHVYIGRKVTLGKNCVLWPNVTIYNGCQIADHVILHSGVAIGCDGFGYIQVDGKNVKVPQIGNVIIEEEVEIGAHTTIDRATIGSTIIRKGVKIDNLVQIAHNVEIGENSIVASQTGISGSTKVGRNCVLLGQVGLADHAVIEDNVVIGAQTGIPSRTVRSEEKFVFGYPGRPLMQAKRIEAVISKLPELYQEFNELKKKIEEKLK